MEVVRFGKKKQPGVLILRSLKVIQN